MVRLSAQGHTVIRRRPEAEKGAKPWFSSYSAGVAYRSGAVGEEYYDIVFHQTYQHFYRCIKSYPASETHAPSQSASTSYWEYMPGYELVVANMLLANSAFINQLVVNQLRVKDANDNTILYAGDKSYPLMAGSDVAANAVTKIGADGKIYATGGEIGGFEISDYAIGVAPTLPPSGSARGAQLMQGEIRSYDFSRGAIKEVWIQTDLNNVGGPLLGVSATGPYSGTAVSISAGNSTTVATALDIARGITKGLRPNVRTISADATLDDDDYTIIAGDSGIIFSLPSVPQVGQTYQILCFGKGVTINGNGKSIKQCFGSGSTVTSFSPDYYGCCMLVYDGTYWYATKFKTS